MAMAPRGGPQIGHKILTGTPKKVFGQRGHIEVRG